MVQLPGKVYLGKANKDSEILIFGKSEDLSADDSKNGLARFGGFMREPSYTNAYFKSAKILLENAREKNELDEFGLPIFYFIRHTIELKIKGILEMAYDVMGMDKELYPERYQQENMPSQKKLKRVGESHDLRKLYEDLLDACKKLDVNVPTSFFENVLGVIDQYEVNSAWSRYSKSRDQYHVRYEVTLPIVKLVGDVEKLFEVISYNQVDDKETLEAEVYFMFASMMQALEEKRC